LRFYNGGQNQLSPSAIFSMKNQRYLKIEDARNPKDFSAYKEKQNFQLVEIGFCD